MVVGRQKVVHRGKKGKSQVKEHVYRTHEQKQWGGGRIECGSGVDRAGESNGGKMGTTEFEQQ